LSGVDAVESLVDLREGKSEEVGVENGVLLLSTGEAGGANQSASASALGVSAELQSMSLLKKVVVRKKGADGRDESRSILRVAGR